MRSDRIAPAVTVARVRVPQVLHANDGPVARGLARTPTLAPAAGAVVVSVAWPATRCSG